MTYDLPASLEVCGVNYEIRTDYRAILDILVALSDIDLNEQERAFVALSIFYPDIEKMPPDDYQEALNRCFWFINCGEDEPPAEKSPKLVDWEQDFPRIAAPVSRIVGKDIRTVELHWWSFMAAYMEIGDCLFAQIVRIRERQAKGKALDKTDKEFYRKNRHWVDFKQRFSEQETDLLRVFGAYK